jgi:uncharacterized delta-60 repeat protein
MPRLSWHRGSIVAVAASLALLGTLGARPGPSAAAASKLDKGFAPGFQALDLQHTDDVFPHVRVRPTGETVLGWSSQQPNTSATLDKDVVLYQVQSNGVRDLGFGDHGAVLVGLPEGAQLLDFALDSDGSISGLASGSTHSYVFKLDDTGSPDASFGTGGVLTLTDDSSVHWQAIAVAPDHRLILAGRVADPTNETLVKRLTSSGLFDAETGVSESSSGDSGRAVAISPNGGLIAVASDVTDDGTGHSAIGVLMLDGDTFDPTPDGTNGVVTVRPSSGNVAASAINVKNSGKVVVAGFTLATHRKAFVARLTSGEALDSSFSGDGMATVAMPDLGRVNSLDVDSAGRYVITGSLGGNGVNAARLASDGNLDSTFGTGGVRSFVLGSSLGAYSGALAPDGSPVIAGDSVGADADIGVVRLTPAGDLDAGFHAGGVSFYDDGSSPSDHTIAEAVAAGSNGTIYAAGISNSFAPSGGFVVARMLADGRRDLAFGFQGEAHLLDGGIARGIAVASGNRPVAVGCSACAGTPRFAVVRLTKVGQPDASFSGDGIATTSFGATVDSTARGVAIQKDGKIVAVGDAGSSFGLVRYTTGGALDHTFSGDGKQTTSFGGLQNIADAVAIQSNGRIVVAGTKFTASGERFAIARFTASGAPDATFGNGGRVTTAFSGDQVEATSLAIRPDGRIIVAGHATGTMEGVAIARYLGNGKLDKTFNGTGKLVAPLGTGSDAASGVAAVGNKIVIGGLNGAGGGQFMIARFTASGALDASFAGTGHQETGTGVVGEDIDSVSGMAVTASGHFILAGAGTFLDGATDIVLAEYKP